MWYVFDWKLQVTPNQMSRHSFLSWGRGWGAFSADKHDVGQNRIVIIMTNAQLISYSPEGLTSQSEQTTAWSSIPHVGDCTGFCCRLLFPSLLVSSLLLSLSHFFLWCLFLYRHPPRLCHLMFLYLLFFPLFPYLLLIGFLTLFWMEGPEE